MTTGMTTPRRIEVDDDEAFWAALEEFTPPIEVYRVQGDAHFDIDLRLSEAIDALLVPEIGVSEVVGTWRQNLDVYGDGIRSLLFASGVFRPERIPTLQALLVGECAEFTILCQVYGTPGEDDNAPRIGAIAIRHDALLVSRPLVEHFKGRL